MTKIIIIILTGSVEVVKVGQKGTKSVNKRKKNITIYIQLRKIATKTEIIQKQNER